MKKLFKLQLSKNKLEKGFVTLEVLVALLAATGFVILSLQFLVAAMAFKVQAQEKQRANQLIQEDIERLNQLGTTLVAGVAVAGAPAGTAPMCNPTDPDGAGALTVYDNSFAQALWIVALPAGVQTKNVLENINQTDGSFDTNGKQLGLQRFHISGSPNGNNSDAPHRTLKVGYRVWNIVGGNFVSTTGAALTATDEPIAETYVEIIPDAALQCP